MRFLKTLCAMVVATLGTLQAMAQSSALTVAGNVNISKAAGDNAEETIAINPRNPLNLFADDTWSVVGRYTLDGGATWSTSDVSALGTSDGDVSSAFDDFGNLFLVQFSSASSLQVVVGLSTNGGASFKLLYETSTKKNDQPTIVTGPSSTAGQGAVWISYTDRNNNQVVQGAAVTNLGSVGTFSAAQAVPGGTNGDFGDIVVGPAGQVMVVYQDNTTSEGPDTIHMNLNPTGLGGTFGPQRSPTVTQVGGFTTIPAQPLRSIDSEAGLAWDRSGGPFQGRVYLMYTDRTNTGSYDTDIFVRYSDNSGTNWSAPVRVNDDPQGNGKSQFLPRIALDQTTGYIAVSFYDCRNSVSNNAAEFWAAVSTNGGASFLPNVKVSAGVSSAIPIGSLNNFDYGDYTGLTFFGGVFYPCWADNSNSTGDNPDGAMDYSDMYTARVTVNTPAILVNPRTIASDFVVSVPTTTVSKTYYLEATPALGNPLWTTVTSVAGNGRLVNLTNTNPGAQTFYRARVQ